MTRPRQSAVEYWIDKFEACVRGRTGQKEFLPLLRVLKQARKDAEDRKRLDEIECEELVVTVGMFEWRKFCKVVGAQDYLYKVRYGKNCVRAAIDAAMEQK